MQDVLLSANFIAIGKQLNRTAYTNSIHSKLFNYILLYILLIFPLKQHQNDGSSSPIPDSRDSPLP